ncbi:unnamed protein product, partial [marine sediment metagenome]
NCSFVPASNMKLVTGAAALLLLGADYRFRTEVYAADFDAKSGAAKALFIQGFGDPSRSERFYETNGAAADALAAELVAHGLRRVDGDLILDDTFFQAKDTMPADWMKEDLKYCYAPRMGSLSVAGNCLKVKITGAARGKKAVVETDPPVDTERFVNHTVTNRSKRGRVSATLKDNGTLVVSGSVRSGRSVSKEYPLRVPALFYGNVLSGALRRLGVPVKGRILLYRKTKTNLESFTRFTTLNSPPLADILAAMQKHSDNFIAEQIVRTVGGGRNGGTTEAGTALISKTMHRSDLAASWFLRVFDGSGLSRSNRLTPDVLINLLSWLYHSNYRDLVLATLATPGGEGTMEKRLVGTPAQGRLWAKTGALRGVCS